MRAIISIIGGAVFTIAPCALNGEVPERFNGAVSKTVVPKGTGGSNPPLSARKAALSVQL